MVFKCCRLNFLNSSLICVFILIFLSHDTGIISFTLVSHIVPLTSEILTLNSNHKFELSVRNKVVVQTAIGRFGVASSGIEPAIFCVGGHSISQVPKLRVLFLLTNC